MVLLNFARALQQSHKIVLKSVKCLQTARHLSSSAALKERRFTEKHEWITIDCTTGIIGISKYAQESLGDVVFAQLPDVGTELKQGDECGALESVKAATEIYTPVSGVVTEKNIEVEEMPGLINSDCFTKGWLFKIKLSRASELDGLMTEEQYNKYLTDSDQ